MAYNIVANNVEYEIHPQHAARNMLRRAITEEMVVRTIEEGELVEQPHGRDLYELQIFDENLQHMRIIQVIIVREERLIITVIDDTDEKFEDE